MVYNKNTEKAVEENKVGERKTNLGPKRNGCIRKQKVRQIEKEQTVREKKKRNVLTCQKANLVCLLKFKNKARTRLSPFTVLLLREPGPGVKVTKRYLRRVLQQMKAVQLRKVSLPEAHLL